MKRPLIKAGKLTNLTDARYYAAHEVQWLGFLFEKDHPDAISVDLFRAIKSWVEGPFIIAEIGQIWEDDQGIKNLDARIEEIYDEVDGFQINDDQEVPQQWIDDEKIIIQGSTLLDINQSIENSPLTGQELLDWVEKTAPYAIEFLGSEEEKIGYKSYEDIDDFFEYFAV